MRGHTESRNLHLFARVRCFSLVALAAVLLFGECRADSQTGKKATQKAANLVIVSTAQELQDAVVLGAPHIQIRAHLDLANLSLLEVLLLGELPATVQSITGNCTDAGAPSFNVPQGHAPLRPLLPRQCLLLANHGLLEVYSSKLWLDSLYLRLTSPTFTDDFGEFFRIGGPGAQVWMTDIMVQGNGNGIRDCGDCGLHVWLNAEVYAEGCAFTDFDGYSLIGTYWGASTSLVGCQFENNTLVPHDKGSSHIQAAGNDDNGDAQVRLQRCTFSSSSTPPSVPTLLADNRATENWGVFYSDSANISVCNFEGPDDEEPPPPCNISSPNELAFAPRTFLTLGDSWLVTVQQSIGYAPDIRAQDSSASEQAGFLDPSNVADAPGTAASEVNVTFLTSTASPGPDMLNTAVMSAGAALVLMLLILALVVLLFIRIRQRKKGVPEDRQTSKIQASEPDVHEGQTGMNTLPSEGSTPGMIQITSDSTLDVPYGTLMHSASTCSANNRPSTVHTTDMQGVLLPPSSSGTSSQHKVATVSSSGAQYSTAHHISLERLLSEQGDQGPDTLGMLQEGMPPSHVGSSVTDPMYSTIACTTVQSWSVRKVPPSKDSSAEEKEQRMLFITQMLDCFGPHHLLLGRYELLGDRQRRTGGQSVVQFARRTDGTGTALFAVKFFESRAGYDEEVRVYREAPMQLQRFMPSVSKYVDNLNSSVCDPFGNPLPPFIVMEKGESLSDRAHRMPVDLFTAAQVLGHVSERIAQLHEAGYVHRDLKPSNIMWQPRSYSWVLIDFGISAALGEPATVAFTPTYAAPETVAAHFCGEKKVSADAAVDAWALGVIAFELLVQRPAFGFLADLSQAHKDLVDPTVTLPWENGRITIEDIQKLGMFRGAILKLLQRDPRVRATARQFSEDVRNLFATGHSTTSRGAPVLATSSYAREHIARQNMTQ